MNRPVLSIHAHDLDGHIGVGNSLGFDCLQDFTFFRQATVGNVVIMGRKTYESLGSRPLVRRRNIVITSRPHLIESARDAIVVSSIEEALAYAQRLNLTHYNAWRRTTREYIYIIGGAQLYMDTIDLVDGALVSVIGTNIGQHHKGKLCGQEYTEALSNKKHKGYVRYYHDTIYNGKTKVLLTHANVFPRQIESEDPLVSTTLYRYDKALPEFDFN